MSECSLDYAPDVAEGLRQPRAPKCDDCGLDVRRRPEDGPREGMQPCPLRRQLNEHRDRAIGFGGRHREEAVGDLALHHHAPQPDGGQAVQALGDDGRRDVVRQVRDELGGCRVERRQVEAKRVAPMQRHVVTSTELAEMRLEARVDLDGVDVLAAVGEHAREDAESRADLEHDVLSVELREPRDDAEDVVVDEEVLTERLLRRDTHGSVGTGRPNASVAFASICRSSAPTSSPRVSASTASVWRTFAGSLRFPRSGCGARYGLSVSARMRSTGTAAAEALSSAAFGNVTLPANET